MSRPKFPYLGDAFGPRCGPFGAQPPAASSCKHRISIAVRLRAAAGDWRSLAVLTGLFALAILA